MSGNYIACFYLSMYYWIIVNKNWWNGLKQTPITSQYHVSNKLKTQRVYDLVYRPNETKYYDYLVTWNQWCFGMRTLGITCQTVSVNLMMRFSFLFSLKRNLFFPEVLPFLSFFIEDCHTINYYVVFAFSCDDLSCHCCTLNQRNDYTRLYGCLS